MEGLHGEIKYLERHVTRFRLLAKRFYFKVLFSKYKCPHCRGRLWPAGLSVATCECGMVLDPTVEFQRSRCCNVPLAKKILHYACTSCGKIVPSRFLFDERLFDREYFRRMVAKGRVRQRAEDKMLECLVNSNSGTLWLTDELDLNKLDGLLRDIDRLCEATPDLSPFAEVENDPEFNMSAYWQHILALLESDEILFSSIAPLHPEARKDRVWRFTTLIFMEHEREVCLSQYGNNILVEKA